MKLAKNHIQSVFSNIYSSVRFFFAFPCYCIATTIFAFLFLHQFSFLSNSVVLCSNASLYNIFSWFPFCWRKKKEVFQKSSETEKYRLLLLEAANDELNKSFVGIVRFLNFRCFCLSAIFLCRPIHFRSVR